MCMLTSKIMYASISFQEDIKFKWSRWTDDLSGIDHFEYEVYELVINGSQLDHIIGTVVDRNKNMSVTTSEV